MGAYSPAAVVTAEVEEQVMETIVRRTASAMVAEGAPFRGVLFAGLMIKDGKVRSLAKWHHHSDLSTATSSHSARRKMIITAQCCFNHCDKASGHLLHWQD